jgi:hypothetical protein
MLTELAVPILAERIIPTFDLAGSGDSIREDEMPRLSTSERKSGQTDFERHPFHTTLELSWLK